MGILARGYQGDAPSNSPCDRFAMSGLSDQEDDRRGAEQKDGAVMAQTTRQSRGSNRPVARWRVTARSRRAPRNTNDRPRSPNPTPRVRNGVADTPRSAGTIRPMP